MSRINIVYSDEFLNYFLGSSHPLQQIRVKMAIELIQKQELTDLGISIVKPRKASREELLLFHTEEYLNFIKDMSEKGEGLLDSGDTPAFKGCYEASATIVGGSLTAVDEVLSGRADHSINFAGGLHHAHPGSASGFCIFNDVAVTIAYLLEKKGFSKVLYLDIDAHHGDGVMYGFYRDPRVLDIDIHESGRYLFPGTGFPEENGAQEGEGFKINIPLPPFSGDDAFLYAFQKVVPKLVRQYSPEYIILQCGADGYYADPLTHLNYTTKAYIEAARTIHALAHELCEGRLTILGGGGYSIKDTARIWTIVTAIILGDRQVPSRLEDKTPTRSSTSIMAEVSLTVESALKNSFTTLGKSPPSRQKP